MSHGLFVSCLRLWLCPVTGADVLFGAADPVAGAYLVAPHLFDVQPLPLRVVQDGPESGRTVVDPVNGDRVMVVTGANAVDIVSVFALLTSN